MIVYKVKHTVNKPGTCEVWKPGEDVSETDLAGADIEHLLRQGAIELAGGGVPAVEFKISADASSATEKLADAQLKAAEAEIERLKAIAKEAAEIIDVLTDDELAELRGRVEAKKAADKDKRSVYEAKTKPELLELCKSRGIEASQPMKKDEIIDLLTAADNA